MFLIKHQKHLGPLSEKLDKNYGKKEKGCFQRKYWSWNDRKTDEEKKTNQSKFAH